MKKINSIWYGSRILAAGGVFTFVIPFTLYLVSIRIVKNDVMLILAKASIAVGLAIFLLFFIMLIIELKQDRNINLRYNKLKYQKIQISVGVYECQHCGNQKVKKNDSFCKICDVKFR